MNIGNSSKLIYDNNFYSDHLEESINPGNYRLQQFSTYNINSCKTPFGVLSGIKSGTVSTSIPFGPAMAQQLVDIESNLNNINIKQSRTRTGRVNIVDDINKYNKYNNKDCNDILSPEYSHYTSSPKDLKGTSINRFYNLHRNPQEPIFMDFAVNTKLEAIDNFIPYYQKTLSKNILTSDQKCNCKKN
jgi:hypothetical protein